MIDINLIRTNPELVKANMEKKFKHDKLAIVDDVKALDEEYRAIKIEADTLRQNRNTKSQEIGICMREKNVEKANILKTEVGTINDRLKEIEVSEQDLGARIKNLMMQIPNIIDSTVPIGKDDSENVEIEKYGEPLVPEYEIPYHSEILDHAVFHQALNDLAGSFLHAAGQLAHGNFLGNLHRNRSFPGNLHLQTAQLQIGRAHV